ncbi:hypothetical protein TNIN_173131 [Trichonephila inaurata madagascariensis]|uniref:Uncharacterized protein n=1 Tax=Trichonephila inaurata madagascariensis TaxID=2747483 RepID=A0A8X6X4Q2_9ARAC|nr:hypothetical protein TNIN_173131 [Trichonephila inaurata madagascariensis]
MSLPTGNKINQPVVLKPEMGKTEKSEYSILFLFLLLFTENRINHSVGSRVFNDFLKSLPKSLVKSPIVKKIKSRISSSNGIMGTFPKPSHF